MCAFDTPIFSARSAISAGSKASTVQSFDVAIAGYLLKVSFLLLNIGQNVAIIRHVVFAGYRAHCLTKNGTHGNPKGAKTSSN
jgi:hypothetical protein